MGLNEPIEPLPDAEAEAQRHVDEEIAEERAREAAVDEDVEAAQAITIGKMEAAGMDSTGSPADEAPASRGWLARIRSMLGLG